ncbi:MAG TPA: A/G-specific adenine glycosylase [Thermoanaerobaculia bacterium]|nr:A/G-specific adenine glycosylase [Thermoanaerobaculia bacterium]HQN07626.1 A/G-specific adenine glycosylase [Thermoanaerobaculia bacterium]HQP84652.1 A/G-specific adenine glycosylase [Thermoanaerobaculia bacterium]
MRRSQGERPGPHPAALRAALLRWFRKHRRDLPFRRTRDPWAVWLSETVLQQTTVAAGAPRFERLLARFPTVEALASADERELLAAWSGLGYYARARNLHRAARLVAERGGLVPRTVDELRALPGVGPYTAAAVASLAFGVPIPLVDGNVSRVLSRLGAIPGDGRSGRSGAAVAEAAADFLDRRRPAEHNEALMELGALVCLPRAPRCPDCPLRAGCRALALGRPEELPAPRARKPAVRLRLAAGVARRDDRLVLVADGHLVRGHLVVPMLELPSEADAARLLRTAWPGLAGRRARRLAPLGRVRHSVLERLYAVDVFDVEEAGPTDESVPVRLVLPRDLESEPRGGLLGKVLALSASSGVPAPPARARPAPSRPRRTGG